MQVRWLTGMLVVEGHDMRVEGAVFNEVEDVKIIFHALTTLFDTFL